MVDTVTEAVNAEVNNKVADVAALAAAQVDQANRDAEALARAAAASEHAARLNALEGNVTSWKMETEARLTKQQEEITAAIAASQASILAQLQPPPPPPVKVETPLPEVRPENEGGQSAGEKPQTEKKEPESPPRRIRKLL
jgi:ABC-type transporter Mla subunit MlaD